MAKENTIVLEKEGSWYKNHISLLYVFHIDKKDVRTLIFNTEHYSFMGFDFTAGSTFLKESGFVEIELSDEEKAEFELDWLVFDQILRMSKKTSGIIDLLNTRKNKPKKKKETPDVADLFRVKMVHIRNKYPTDDAYTPNYDLDFEKFMEAELNEIDQEVLEEENEAHNAFHTEQMRILKEEADKLAKNTSVYKNQDN